MTLQYWLGKTMPKSVDPKRLRQVATEFFLIIQQNFLLPTCLPA